MNLNTRIWCAFSEHYPGTEAEIRGESGGETEHEQFLQLKKPLPHGSDTERKPRAREMLDLGRYSDVNVPTHDTPADLECKSRKC